MGYVGQAPAAKVLTSADIADDAIDSDQIAAGAVDAAHMSVNSIDSDSYVDGSIDNAHLADDAVDSDEIAAGAIDNAHLADDAVDSDELAAGAVDEAHIADNQVTLAKMAGIARGKIIYGDASGDPAVLASGDAGEVLTMTDGDDFDWAAGASSTQEFTASGAISTGDYVSLNSNGTVSSSTSPAVNTAAVEFESGNCGKPSLCYDVDQNRVVIAYYDLTNSQYGTAVVGTVSGGAITFGTPVVFESAAILYASPVYDTNIDRVVITYRDDGNSYYGTAIVGEVDDTAIRFDESAAVFNEGNTGYGSSVFAPDGNDPTSDTAADGRVVTVYRDDGNSGYGTAVVIEAAADHTIAFGTPVVFESADTYFGTVDNAVAYDPDTNRVVIAYDDNGNSSYGTAIVGEISDADNNVIEFGTAAVFESATVNNTGIAYDTNSNKMVICYRDVGDNSNGKAIVGTVTGGETNSIAFGTASEAFDPATGSYYLHIYFDPSENKLVALWENYISSPVINYGTLVLGTVSGTDITWDTDNEFYWNRATTTHQGAVYDPDSTYMVIAYRDTADSNAGKCVLIDNSVTNNFLSWIGIAGTGVSDTETVSVNMLGTINENQSGLTVGSKYYMQHDGTVTTSSIDNRQVGMATATTKLFITAGSVS